MKKKITTTRMMTLIIALVIILPQTILAFSGSGSGTEVDPYIITDVDQLQEMNNELDAWYELGNNIDASGTSGWNGGAGFVPIGSEVNKFTGHFDGKGHTITGLFVNRRINDKGLFGYTDIGSEVKNVGLIDFNITGSAGMRNGCLIGFSCSDVTDCYSNGSVEASSSFSGGLVGLNSAPITNCYSIADLNNSVSSVGGLVGRNYATTVTNCYSAGHVDGEKYNIGGCIGENMGGGTSPNCFWDIETSGQETSAGGTGKTTTQMKTESISGWGWSTDIWERIGYNYPRLINNPDPTLPVTLSTFTVQYLNNIPTLYWTTQSETDNIGWNVYRNTEEDLCSAQVITNELIPGNGTTTETSYYIFKDNDDTLEIGQTYWYWLENIDLGGITHYSIAVSITIPDPGGEPSNIEPPVVYVLETAPNPMNTSTYFCFTLDKSVEATISIYNIKGELVRTLPKVWADADEETTIYWNGKDNKGNELQSGIYLYQLQVSGKIHKSSKLIITR